MKVPPGWVKGEPIKIIGTGPRYAVERDIWEYMKAFPLDEIALEFNSKEDLSWWCAWWLAKPWTLSI